jgi:hypothetical protein
LVVPVARALELVEDAVLDDIALIVIAELLATTLEDVLIAFELRLEEERLELARLLTVAEQARTNSHACDQ